MPRRKPRVRIGMAGYALILAVLRDHPCTCLQLQERTGFGKTAINRLLPGFYMLRMIHIQGWAMETNRATQPIYRAGHAPDAPLPLLRPNGKPVSGFRAPTATSPGSELIAFKSIMDALEEPVTCNEIAEESGVFIRSAWRIVEVLAKYRLAHIAGWESRPDGAGPPQRLFLAGAGKNAPRPKPMTQQEKNARYNARRRAALATENLAQVLIHHRDLPQQQIGAFV